MTKDGDERRQRGVRRRADLARWFDALVQRMNSGRSLDALSELDLWRAQLLAALLLVGGIAMTLALAVYLRLGQTAFALFDLAIYVCLLIIMSSRTLSFRARAWVIVAATFLVGTASMVHIGPQAAGMMWLSAASLLAALLLGVTVAICIVAAQAVVLLAIFIAIHVGRVAWAAYMPNEELLFIIASGNFLALSGMLAAAIGVLLRGLEREASLRRVAEANLRRSRQLEALGTLTGGIAHDVNNLLVPILLNSQLLAQTETDPFRRQLFADVRLSAERGRDLVRRMLAFARGTDAEQTSVDVVAMLLEVARLIRATDGPRITVEVNARPLPPIRANTAELHQVVMNLATNAVHAMPRGGALTLSVEPEAPRSESVVIAVTDTGDGMDSAALARVFEPFFTTKAPGRGTGLGLATVHRLVSSMGGRIGVESALTVGTTVRVTLPVALPVEPQPTPRVVPSLGKVDAAPTRVRIVLVDDDVPVLEATRRLLCSLGHDVVAMRNADDAAATIARDPLIVDLLITDFRMPGRSGVELAESVRGIRSDLPIVIASGFPEATIDAWSSTPLPVILLAKPFDRSTLALAITDALMQRAG